MEDGSIQFLRVIIVAPRAALRRASASPRSPSGRARRARRQGAGSRGRGPVRLDERAQRVGATARLEQYRRVDTVERGGLARGSQAFIGYIDGAAPAAPPRAAKPGRCLHFGEEHALQRIRAERASLLKARGDSACPGCRIIKCPVWVVLSK
jgi:hypothetical protein